MISSTRWLHVGLCAALSAVGVAGGCASDKGAEAPAAAEGAEADEAKSADESAEREGGEHTALSSYQCRAMQSEARASLGAIAISQNMHHDDVGEYSTSLSELGAEAYIEGEYYRVEILEAGAEGYRAAAIGLGPMEGDRWEMDEDGEPEIIDDSCEP